MNEMIHSLEEFLSLFPFSERDSLILRNFNTYLTNRNKLNSNIPYGLLIQCSDSELANTFLHHLDAYIETAFSRRYSLVHMTESSLAFYDIRKRINSNQLLVLTDFQDSGDIDQLYQAFTATPDIVKIVIASEDVIKSRFYPNDDFFYRLLPRHITLSAGGPKEICNQFILSFGQSYRLSDAFKSELFYYIETVYPQADFQGNAFVEDLKNRITRQLLEIPDYQKYISAEEMGAEFVPYSTKVLERKKAELAADILEKPAPVPVFPEFTPLQMESKERATAVILFFLSEYRPANQAVYTSPDGKEYYGIQTVDAPIQYLIDCAARDGATDFVCLCITSHKVYTSKYGDSDYSTFERTEKLISDYTDGHASVPMLRYDFDEKDQPISDLNEISNRMFMQLQKALKSYPDAHSYIEYTGGLRDISFLMTSIVRYLEFSGISFKKIVYSNFQTKHLYDLDYIYNIYQIINGTSEFLEYGNSRQLQKLFGESTSGSGLLKAIQEFSNAISICSVDEIDNSLKKVVREITKFKNERNDITASMLQYLIPTIREKLCIDQMTYAAADGKRAVNYPILIQWCVDHNLIQQAVTLYIEKMPIYYFNRNILPREMIAKYTSNNSTPTLCDDYYYGVYKTIITKCGKTRPVSADAYMERLDAIRVLENKKIPFDRISQEHQDLLKGLLLYYLSVKMLRNNMNHANGLKVSHNKSKTIEEINQKYLKGVKIENNADAIRGLLNQALAFQKDLQPIIYTPEPTVTPAPSSDLTDTSVSLVIPAENPVKTTAAVTTGTDSSVAVNDSETDYMEEAAIQIDLPEIELITIPDDVRIDELTLLVRRLVYLFEHKDYQDNCALWKTVQEDFQDLFQEEMPDKSHINTGRKKSSVMKLVCNAFPSFMRKENSEDSGSPYLAYQKK